MTVRELKHKLNGLPVADEDKDIYVRGDDDEPLPIIDVIDPAGDGSGGIFIEAGLST